MKHLLACWAILNGALSQLTTDASGSISTLDSNSLYIIGKNRPAKVSTKMTSNTNAALANDGNTNGTFEHGVRCFHTDFGDPLPWWMLDMLEVLAMFGARVWNRIDACSARFTQISLGLTSNPSVWTTFNKDLFDLCMYYTGLPSATDNPISFTCARPIAGRYLAVHMNTSGIAAGDAFLHFCEIDVLAIRKGGSSYAGTAAPSFSSTSTSQVDSNTRSDMECLIRCSMHPHCLYALASPTSTEQSYYDCWLFKSFNVPTSFAAILNGNIGARFLSLY